MYRVVIYTFICIEIYINIKFINILIYIKAYTILSNERIYLYSNISIKLHNIHEYTLYMASDKYAVYP